MAVSNSQALAPEIDEFRRTFEQLAVDADTLVAPLSDEEFHWQPRPGSWSVAQCIDHLNVTARLYLPMLDEGIAGAIRRGLYNAGPFSYNWVGRMLVRLVEPNSRFRAKAPRTFQPAAGRPRHDVLAAFRAYQVQYIDRLRQASGLDLARARVASPVSRWIRMPLGSRLAFLIAHARRHLGQARRVLETLAQAVPPSRRHTIAPSQL